MYIPHKTFTARVLLRLSAMSVISALLVLVSTPLNASAALSKKSSLNTSSCSASIVGHRGTDEGGVRNNTLAAFQAAVAGGADVIELDIHRTKPNSSGSGTWVVNHDKTIEGKTIANTSYATLKKLRPELTTLRQAVRYIASTDKAMQVEIKPSSVGRGSLKYFASLAKEYDMKDRFEIDSAHKTVLTKFRSLKSGIKTGYVMRAYESPVIVKKVADTALLKSTIATKYKVTALRNAGISVEVWTVDKSTDWSKYMGYYVDGIITDKAPTLNLWCQQRNASVL